MKEKDLTKTELSKVADELSKVMDFETPIKTGRKVTIKQLKTDLAEAAKELREDDEISEESIAVLTCLKIDLPESKSGSEPEKDKKPAIKKEEKIDLPESKSGKPGIIASILEFIVASKKGISMSQIHDKLVARFSDRDGDKMMRTIKMQIGGKKSPCRMEKEKKVSFVIQGDKYAIK